MYDIFVGRQPIYSRHLSVSGYELLFRAADDDHASFIDRNQATSRVVMAALLELDLEKIVGQTPAFVNVTREFVLAGYPAAFPADRVVLEVLEGDAVDRDFVDALRCLADRGYTIALDDFVFSPDTAALLEVADIVKLDVLALGRERVRETVTCLRDRNVRLLAEKIETHEDFAFCRELDFDYYQGFFVCKPDVVHGRRSPVNRLAVMRLLAKLQNPSVDFQEIEEIIVRDVSLSYKLLRLINSAHYGRPQRIHSVRQGLVLLGSRRITTWASLIAMAGIADKPQDLMVTALVRARMCELLAEDRGVQPADSFFAAGLFSVLDALLDLPMAEALQSLPLDDDIVAGILHYDGILGETLACVIAYERGRWEEVAASGFDRRAVTEAYLDAIGWATGVVSAVAV